MNELRVYAEPPKGPRGGSGGRGSQHFVSRDNSESLATLKDLDRRGFTFGYTTRDGERVQFASFEDVKREARA